MTTVPKTLGRRQSVPRQLQMTFETNEMRHLTLAQRAQAVAYLADLLMQAAGGVVSEEDDDDEW